MSKETPDLLDVDAIIEGQNKPPFRFRMGGAERELPNFSTLTLRQAQRMDHGEMEDVLAEVAGEELAALVLDAPGFATDTLVTRWMKHAGEKPGEGRASSR